MIKITKEQISEFKVHLLCEEKSEHTVEKYLRDVTAFYLWTKDGMIDKEMLLQYKSLLYDRYAPASVNSIISSLNSFFSFCNMHELKIRTVKVQRQVFASRDRELSKREYERLLTAARRKNNMRLLLLMQTICASGIRVSELKYVTVEALAKEKTIIKGKGKLRSVFLPSDLCKMLRKYVENEHIKTGAIFITKGGRPIDRSNIWKLMKALCDEAGVDKSKVYPHNLRHLFARTFYSQQKDVVRLADILGHSNVETTRIYTMETGEVHRRQIQKLGLLEV